jgi:hypothetical protein
MFDDLGRRKILVANIAANIFESLKNNSDMREILKDLLLTDEKTKRWIQL